MNGSNPRYTHDDELSYESQQRSDRQRSSPSASSQPSHFNQPVSGSNFQYQQDQRRLIQPPLHDGFPGGIEDELQHFSGREDLERPATYTYPPKSHLDSHTDPYTAPPSSSSSSSPSRPLYLSRSQSGQAQLQPPHSADGQLHTALPSPSSRSRIALLPPSPTLSDGIYADRPIRWDLLNAEQRLIAETFPKDLDEDGKTMRDSCTQVIKDWRSWIRWTYWYYYLACILLTALVIVFVVLHDKIVAWLTPISTKVNSVDWGWIIPVAILFVISFPPLFGHELIGILCGVVYPFWQAFGIVALGTLLGEWGNFWAFGACLQGVANRYERKSLNYACMAHIVREGGLWIILVARLSAIPGHFTTAVFSTVGMSFWMFTLATILSMPKQLAVVYVGYAIRTSGTGEESTTAKIIKWVVLVITGIITIAAAWYLYRKMEAARPEVQRRLRLKRYTLLSGAKEISPSILLKKGNDADDGFSLVRMTNERVVGGVSRPRHDGAEGDIGIVRDRRSNKHDGDEEATHVYAGGAQKDQLGYPLHHEEYVGSYPGLIPVRIASKGRTQRSDNDTQAPPRQNTKESTLVRNIGMTPDAGASTEALLLTQQRQQRAPAHGSAPLQARLQLHHEGFVSQESRSDSTADNTELIGNSAIGVEPLDMNVLLAATNTRATPPRPGPGLESETGASFRPSPPRYEMHDWTGANVDSRNAVQHWP